MRKFLRPRNIILALIALIIVWAIWGAVSASSAPKQVAVTAPRNEDLIVTISASGKIQPKNTASLRFAASGRITSLPVQEGDIVKKGQVLGYISAADIKAQEEKAIADYRYQLELFREFEKNNENKPRDDRYTMDRWQIEAQIDSTEAILAQVRTGYNNRTLIAPIDGQITKIYKFQGDIASGDVILDIQNGNEVEFIAEVDEQDIGMVQQGQSVKVNLDAYPREELSASIIEIEDIAQTGTTGNTFFPVNMLISTTSLPLRLGMNGDAEITTEQAQNTLVIPLELLLETDDGRPFVYVAENGTVQQKIVQTGLQNDIQVQILSGISTSDQIITSDTTNLKVNDKVEVKN